MAVNFNSYFSHPLDINGRVLGLTAFCGVISIEFSAHIVLSFEIILIFKFLLASFVLIYIEKS